MRWQICLKNMWMQLSRLLRKLSDRVMGKLMIKYAVIGRGKIVDTFIEGARLSGKLELEAIYSRQADTGREYANKQGVSKVYTDISDLVQDKEIQAVYIASPNSCHEWQSEQLLRGGKHVICEKPIVTSLEGYRRLKSLADELGLIYMEAIIPIFGKSRGRIEEALGMIGNIVMAKIDYCQLSSRYNAFMRGEHVNIFDMSLAAGTLMDLGIYCVYAAVNFFGRPTDIKASASYLYNGADGSGSAIFNYKSFPAVLSYSKLGQSLTPCEIIGDKGSIIIERVGLYMGAYLVLDDKRTPLFDEEPKDILMSYEAAAFADFIQGEQLERYEESSRLCVDVHWCMDEIKRVVQTRLSE